MTMAMSGGAAQHGAQHLLNAPICTPAHGLAMHPQLRRLKTKKMKMLQG